MRMKQAMRQRAADFAKMLLITFGNEVVFLRLVQIEVFVHIIKALGAQAPDVRLRDTGWPAPPMQPPGQAITSMRSRSHLPRRTFSASVRAFFRPWTMPSFRTMPSTGTSTMRRPFSPRTDGKSGFEVFAGDFFRCVTQDRFTNAAGITEDDVRPGLEAHGHVKRFRIESGKPQSGFLDHTPEFLRSKDMIHFRRRRPLIESGRLASNFFAMQGMMATMIRFSFLTPNSAGNISLTRAPSICCGDLQVERFGNSSGNTVRRTSPSPDNN